MTAFGHSKLSDPPEKLFKQLIWGENKMFYTMLWEYIIGLLDIQV